MLTVMVILALASFATAVGSAMGKVPGWVPVVLLSVLALLQVLPK